MGFPFLDRNEGFYLCCHFAGLETLTTGSSEKAPHMLGLRFQLHAENIWLKGVEAAFATV